MPNPGRTPGGGHWPQADFALMLGGGLKTGQVVGATESKGARPVGRPYTPQNVLATLYHVLGIDPLIAKVHGFPSQSRTTARHG
jgi:hypothetical protein